MKRYFRRIPAVFMILILLLAGITGCGKSSEEKVSTVELENDISISVWYTDSGLTDYMERIAAQYKAANPHVTIVPTLVTTDEYLENIYHESISGSDAPDVFMMSSDNLEKAYLMGIVAENDTYASDYTTDVYGDAAISASSLKGRLYGYPMAYDTAVMVYNKKYAQSVSTFDELTSISDNFEHTEDNAEVEIVAKWDVSDLMLNYAFVGNYINMGGDSFEDKAQASLDDAGMLNALNAYANLREDYGIVRNATTQQACLESFENNKLLYTIVRASDLKELNESGVDYGVIKIPDLSDSIPTRAMSTTQMAAVNPYSDQVAVAKSVAKAMTYDYASGITELTKYPAARGDLKKQPNEEYTQLHQIYSDSVVKAKFMEIGELYIKLEVMMHQIWDEGNVEQNYATFRDYVQTEQTMTTLTAQ